MKIENNLVPPLIQKVSQQDFEKRILKLERFFSFGKTFLEKKDVKKFLKRDIDLLSKVVLHKEKWLPYNKESMKKACTVYSNFLEIISR